MRTSYIFRSLTVSLLFAVCGLLSVVSAQTTPNQPTDPAQQQSARTTVILPEERGPSLVAGQTELYCAGYIQYAPATGWLEIVGGQQEQEQHRFTEGDYVFVNAGSQQGVRVGQEFSIIRPRGELLSAFTKKKGWLGVYVQEMGQLRITEVKERVSVALVTTSCETILLGDFLRPAPARVSPVQRQEAQLNRFSDPQSGKPQGRILLARDGRELLTRNQIVYIDLGAEDNIKAGDYLTISRPLGTGNISPAKNEEFSVDKSVGFGSEKFKGTRFGNQSQRTKDYGGNAKGIYFGPAITSREVKGKRPPMPRKVVGEMVILSVQTRTATAVITRIAQEVHTGDYVEVQ